MEKYQLKKVISYQEVDFSGNLKLYNLFSTLSEIATEHALKINVWNHDLDQDYGWVVAKIAIEILSPIQYEEETVFKTWPGHPSRVIFPRFYTIEDKNGNIKAKISSVWTLLDLKKRRITLPSKAGIQFPEDIIEEEITLPKELDITDGFHLVNRKNVSYSDLDTNRHVNNAKYMEWVCDLLPYEKFERSYIENLTIHFKKEITYGSVACLYLKEEGKTFTVYGSDEENKIIYFIVEGCFHSR